MWNIGERYFLLWHSKLIVDSEKDYLAEVTYTDNCMKQTVAGRILLWGAGGWVRHCSFVAVGWCELNKIQIMQSLFRSKFQEKNWNLLRPSLCFEWHFGLGREQKMSVDYGLLGEIVLTCCLLYSCLYLEIQLCLRTYPRREMWFTLS